MSGDDSRTRALLALVEWLKAHDYPRVQTLPAPHPRPTFLGIGKELVTASSPAARASDSPRLFDPSAFAPVRYVGFQARHPQLFLLFTAFFLNRTVELEPLRRCLGERLVQDLIEQGVVMTNGRSGRSIVRVVPYRRLLLLTDAWDRQTPDFTYLGKDSIDMAEFLTQRLGQRRFSRGLDLCSGSGIHALLLADRCQEVVGVDLNPRAVWYAQRNALLNRKDRVRFLCANLLSPLEGRFDLIVSNPPLRFLPTDEQRSNRDGFGGALGIELTRQVLSTLEGRLGEGGLGIIGSVAPVVRGEHALVQDAERLFAGKPFEIEFIFTDLTYSREHQVLHQRHEISYLLPCYIVVERSMSYRMTLTERISYRPIKQAVARLRARSR